MRADQVTPSVATALARAGCRMVWMGAESGSQTVLDAMEKGLRVEQIRTATALLQGAGIEVGFFLQFGYPGETWTDIERRCSWCARSSPTTSASRCRIRCRARGSTSASAQELGAKQNWVDSNDLAMMYQATYAPEFYRACTASCITSSARASPRTRCRRSPRTPWEMRPVARARGPRRGSTTARRWRCRRRLAPLLRAVVPNASRADAS